MRLIAAGVFLCFLLVGCAAPSSVSVAPTSLPPTSLDPATPVDLMPNPSSIPVPAEVPAGEIGTMFTSTPELIRSTSTPFEAWSKISDDVIAIHFVTGSPECYGADAIVTESNTAVTIELRTGTLPKAANKPCMLISLFGTMEIELKSPLGNRAVLNAG